MPHKTIALFLAVLFAALPGTGLAVSQDGVIHWAGCGITKKAFMGELAKAYTRKTGIKIDLAGGGATRGIRDTVNLKVDMGGSCRMTLPETDRVELHASLHPVAWDALAVITNTTNPVNNLTMDQIKKIYKGRIRNWKQLGGRDAPINLYIRRGTISGVGYAIRQYIFKNSNERFYVADKDFVKRSSGPLEKAVVADPNGVAITGISSARKRKLKIVSIEHYSPTYKNVKSGKYILYRPLYLVTTSSPSREVKQFIAFANSEEGRAIIRKNKTVPYRDAPQLMSKMLIYGFDVR
jgi:phosphate transport system substrate-binding protein